MNKLALPYNNIDTGLDTDITRRTSNAIKSLANGTCSSDEQKYILDFIVTHICRTYDSDWFPEERISCFAAGRRYVGQQLVRLLNFKIGALKDK